jgi:16S rRNA (cytosine967-C5)-methyltransferase
MAGPRCSADVAGTADASAAGAQPHGRRGRPHGQRGGGAGTRGTGAGASRGPGRGPDRDQARKAALELLLAVSQRDAYANLLLPELIAKRRLTGRDAALATELGYGTLRGQGTYDAVLGVCSDRDLTTLDPAVLAILRLGTHQLLSTRIAPHAAVATSVNLVKDTIGQRPAGFVNAVLRRVSSRDLAGWLEIVAPARDTDPAGHLAVRYSHPRWIVEALAAALGEPAPFTETEELLAADSQRPLVHLCAVPGLASQEELAAAGAEPARWSPYGAYLADGDPAAVAAVAAGRAGVQDEASQLAALALSRAGVSGPDDRWLDLCAGPGGKARLLSGLAAGTGSRLLAAEVREHRARLVRAATSLPGATAATVIADGVSPAWRPAAFSRVIADVPCSGLGALRRRPEARWRRTPDDIVSLGGLQRALLGSALDAARPGGVVAYVTCSPHLAETASVVTDVLAGRTDSVLLDAPGLLPEVPGLRHRADERLAQFWPHWHGTDAIFLALIRRQ